jgi:hypothetical protein
MEEYKRVFENMVLKRIFGPKTDMKVKKGVLLCKYCYDDEIRRWMVHLARMGLMRNAYAVRKSGSPNARKKLGRPVRRREDNIKINLKNGWKCVYWIHLAHDGDGRDFMKTRMVPRVPQ